MRGLYPFSEYGADISVLRLLSVLLFSLGSRLLEGASGCGLDSLDWLFVRILEL